ncbi:hypothetical protein [Salinarimonas sp.]|uniref:hypothetical protein n=1 Tax=Salinarimonas sp. TaxID=2766526 RepID=UPI0032D8EDDF
MSHLPDTRAIWLRSAFADPSEVVRAAEAAGRLTVLAETELTRAALFAHRGLVTGMQIDQDRALGWAADLRDWLAAGGRWLYNGHMMRPLLAGAAPFVPLERPGRADFVLTRLADHPILAGIDLDKLEANRGVAGFYGRGHNPMPEGAVAVTGLGPARIPVDWHCEIGDGAVFSHAGNDIWAAGLEHGLGPVIAERCIAWAGGETPCA